MGKVATVAKGRRLLEQKSSFGVLIEGDIWGYAQFLALFRCHCTIRVQGT